MTSWESVCVKAQTDYHQRSKLSLDQENMFKAKKARQEPALREKDIEIDDPLEAIDPRPLPPSHVRHLDVNKVLERSLPRADASKPLTSD